jgi:hypothetical protein
MQISKHLSAVQIITLILSLSAPAMTFANEPAPGTPDMVADFDTGSSSTDNITNNNTPTFSVSCIDSDDVYVYVDGNLEGQDTCATRGGGSPVIISWGEGQMVYPDMTEGTHSITAKQVNPLVTDDGSPPNYSEALTITVDTTAPTAPDQPDLLASSDLGSSSTDNITSDTTPTIQVACENGATVELYESLTLLGTGTCSGTTIDITTSALALGAHTIKAKQTDVAGNASSLDAATALTVTIEAEAPVEYIPPSSTQVSTAPTSSGGSPGSTGAPPEASAEGLRSHVPDAPPEHQVPSSIELVDANVSPPVVTVILTPADEVKDHVGVRKGERIVSHIDDPQAAEAARELFRRIQERREARREQDEKEKQRVLALIERLHAAATERKQQRMK